ncbi:hypothetical protein GCM10027600_42060 [Nocardioides ginsengisegetis]
MALLDFSTNAGRVGVLAELADRGPLSSPYRLAPPAQPHVHDGTPPAPKSLGGGRGRVWDRPRVGRHDSWHGGALL